MNSGVNLSPLTTASVMRFCFVCYGFFWGCNFTYFHNFGSQSDRSSDVCKSIERIGRGEGGGLVVQFLECFGMPC